MQVRVNGSYAEFDPRHKTHGGRSFEGILGRWTAYARNGAAVTRCRRFVTVDPNHVQLFTYSILRVFGPSTTTAVVDEWNRTSQRVAVSGSLGSTAK